MKKFYLISSVSVLSLCAISSAKSSNCRNIQKNGFTVNVCVENYNKTNLRKKELLRTLTVMTPSVNQVFRNLLTSAKPTKPASSTNSSQPSNKTSSNTATKTTVIDETETLDIADVDNKNPPTNTGDSGPGNTPNPPTNTGDSGPGNTPNPPTNTSNQNCGYASSSSINYSLKLI